MIKIGGKNSTRNSSYYIFGGSSSKSVDTGLSTEWGDRLFQCIIVRGRNENL